MFSQDIRIILTLFHTSSPDPHFGNIGIAVEGISHVSEQDMLKYIEDDVALVSALENIQDDESIDCHNIVPTDARKARLKLYDFGRGM